MATWEQFSQSFFLNIFQWFYYAAVLITELHLSCSDVLLLLCYALVFITVVAQFKKKYFICILNCLYIHRQLVPSKMPSVTNLTHTHTHIFS